jgi:hypothetical protein
LKATVPLLYAGVLPRRHSFCVGSASMKAWAFALIFSLSLLGAGGALAADVPLPGPAPIPPPSYYPPASYYPASAPVNWGGVYIGLNGGYGLGKSNWSNTLGSTGNFAANGGLFGATLGINYAGFGDWVWRLRLVGRQRQCRLLGPGRGVGRRTDNTAGRFDLPNQD